MTCRIPIGAVCRLDTLMIPIEVQFSSVAAGKIEPMGKVCQDVIMPEQFLL